MTRDDLAELIGASLTARLRSGRYWSAGAEPGVKVRQLAADVAADIEGKVLSVSTDSH